MRRHELKVQPDDLGAVLAGTMTHQARRDDRGFQVGDILVLREWVPTAPPACDWKASGQPGTFTGRVACARVTHLTCGQHGLPPELAVMSIKLVSAKNATGA